MTGMASSWRITSRNTETQPRYPVRRSYIFQREVSTASSTPAYPRKRLILASRPVLHPLIRRVKLLAVTTKRRKGSLAPLLPGLVALTGFALCTRIPSSSPLGESRLKTHRDLVNE